MSDTSHLSDTATQPLSRLPATISTASNAIAASSSINPVIAVAVGAGLATAAAGNLAIDIGKKINRTTAAKALHC